MKRATVFACWALGLACAGARAEPAATVVDTIILDPGRFDAAFGGISGIDYDPRHRRWWLLSDDRSEHAPARVYRAKIGRRADGRWRVSHGRRVVLKDARGKVFPAAGRGREAVDAEAIRVGRDGRTLIWTSEGDFKDGFGPAVRRMDRHGRTTARIALPANLVIDPAGRHGPRDNGTLEGLDVAEDGAVWLAMEAPLIEDGPPAADDRSALVRVTRLRDGEPAQQFVYPLDAVPLAATGRKGDNGLSEILMLDARRMLVIERAGAKDADGSYRFHCRLYLADFSKASEVASVATLNAVDIVPASKRLLIDTDDLPANPGNLEAMAWWPSPDGRRDRIVVVNDNNFVKGEPTRLLLMTLPTETTRSAAR